MLSVLVAVLEGLLEGLLEDFTLRGDEIFLFWTAPCPVLVLVRLGELERGNIALLL